jgi:hypothetical protein
MLETLASNALDEGVDGPPWRRNLTKNAARASLLRSSNARTCVSYYIPMSKVIDLSDNFGKLLLEGWVREQSHNSSDSTP